MAQIEYLKPYIEGTMAASARFRRVLIVMIISSVLAFGAFWNARQGSWINQRIYVARTAEACLASEELAKQVKNLETLPDDAPSAAGMVREADWIQESKNKFAQEKNKLLAELKTYEDILRNRDTARARQWLNLSGFTTSEQVRKYAESLEKARTDTIITIRIPFFNTTYDVNELGLLNGFTFVVVLMWFRFSLWREYYNLALRLRLRRILKIWNCVTSGWR